MLPNSSSDICLLLQNEKKKKLMLLSSVLIAVQLTIIYLMLKPLKITKEFIILCDQTQENLYMKHNLL